MTTGFPGGQHEISGHADGRGLHVGVVVSRFNEHITERMLNAALREFHGLGVPDRNVTVVRVPGAVELPLAAKRLAESQRTDAVLCLGVVIRGETAHFEHVSVAARDGILRASLETGKPVIFGVLTTYSAAQAMDRVELGAEYARSTVEMGILMRSLSDAGL